LRKDKKEKEKTKNDPPLGSSQYLWWYR